MNKKDIFSRLDDFEQKSLYSFNNEHDACGVGLAITLNGEKSHSIIEKGLQVLENMVHRGAESSDNITGDGAGILVQIPHEFILLQGIAVPSEGKYGTGLVFLPKDAKEREDCIETIKYYISKEQLTLLHIRDVPVNSECLGEIALSNEPVIKQLFISGSGTQDGARFQKDNSVLKAEQIKKTFRIIELRKVSNYKIKCKSTNKYVYSVELKVDN
jgi:glutamate synthase (NADPH/NADH) large chain